MIVVTGAGRSGTSFLARLYGELGFDPGGRWSPSLRAGLEARDVVDMNLVLATELGVSYRERRGSRLVEAAATRLRRREHGATPRAPRLQQAAGDLVERARYVDCAPNLVHWDRLDEVARRHRHELLSLAASHPLVKGPQFCWTLGAWLAAGVPVEGVVLTLRPLDAMIESRRRLRSQSPASLGPSATTWAKHNYCYGLGLLVAAATEHRVPVSMLRFPDFLEDEELLFRALPLPEPRTFDQFKAAFAAVHDPSLVGDRR